jgi:uncharacterized protein YjdB
MSGCHEKSAITVTCCEPPLFITSVLVAPDTATIRVGQTLRMTVTVQERADSVYSVAWASSDTTKAAVDSTGLVTGKATTQDVAICATAISTGHASVENCANVTVVVAGTPP